MLSRISSHILAFTLILISTSACSIQQRNANDQSIDYQKLVQNPLLPHETRDLMDTAAGNWFYGQGLGHSLIKLSSTIIFPPVAIVWLGELATNSMGYEVKTEENFTRAYQGVAQIPGHITAKASGKKFRCKKGKKQALKGVLRKHEHPLDFSDV